MANQLKEEDLYIEQTSGNVPGQQPELRNHPERPPRPLPRQCSKASSGGSSGNGHTQSGNSDRTVAQETSTASSHRGHEDPSQFYIPDTRDSAPPLPPKTRRSVDQTFEQTYGQTFDQTSIAKVVVEDDESNIYETLPSEKNNDNLAEMEMLSGLFDPNRFLYKKARFEIDLLLIGKTGQGKSELGNSILGRKAFESKPSLSSVTKKVTYEVSEYNGRVIKVVDGPGVCDTDMNVDDARNLVVESLSYAIALNPKGYHAFLLVVKYGERFTRESKLTIDVLKKVFGETFVKNFCILVMTHGDLFEDDINFRDWLNDQKGDLNNLVKECDDRIILYDNRTKEKEKREGLLNTLLDMVQILALEKCRYTDEQFEVARLSRETMTLESKKLLIEEEAMTEASLILGKLQRLQVDTENIHTPKNIAGLQQLLCNTITLLENLKEKDRNTGVLQEMITHVQSLQNSINDEIRLVKRISDMMKNDNAEVRHAVTEKILRQKLVFRSSLIEGTGHENAINEEKKDTTSNLQAKHESDIDIVMGKQWERTRKLEKLQKAMRTKKNNNIFTAIQNKISAALKRKMKEKN